MKENIELREAKESDHNFLYNTWLRSYRQSDYAKHLSNDVFFTLHKQIIKDILNDENTLIVLAVNKNDHEQIYSYVVASLYTNTVLHMCYTKYNYRKLGIVNYIISEYNLLSTTKVNFITHLPRFYNSVKTKYKLEYNPYFLTDIQIKSGDN